MRKREGKEMWRWVSVGIIKMCRTNAICWDGGRVKEAGVVARSKDKSGRHFSVQLHTTRNEMRPGSSNRSWQESVSIGTGIEMRATSRNTQH
jgi:hypothetical protein